VDKELRDLTEKLQNVTNELRDLQQDSVDDSVTVKIITFVSAFYLPGSFVVVCSFCLNTFPSSLIPYVYHESLIAIEFLRYEFLCI
jgi:hypothetical protein